jgi:uncharacterized protein
MTTIFVDADACPVIGVTISTARERRVPVVLVGNETQNLGRYVGRPGVESLQVPSGRDSADFAMVPLLAHGDIVVTGDIGLAAMALAKHARALSPRGRLYLPGTIDWELSLRHAEQRHRRAGGRTHGPPPFRNEDRQAFQEALSRLLDETGGRLRDPRSEKSNAND